MAFKEAIVILVPKTEPQQQPQPAAPAAEMVPPADNDLFSLFDDLDTAPPAKPAEQAPHPVTPIDTVIAGEREIGERAACVDADA